MTTPTRSLLEILNLELEAYQHQYVVLDNKERYDSSDYKRKDYLRTMIWDLQHHIEAVKASIDESTKELTSAIGDMKETLDEWKLSNARYTDKDVFATDSEAPKEIVWPHFNGGGNA